MAFNKTTSQLKGGLSGDPQKSFTDLSGAFTVGNHGLADGVGGQGRHASRPERDRKNDRQSFLRCIDHRKKRGRLAQKMRPGGKQCILAFDRSYPEPVGVVCDDGQPIGLYPNGTLAKCTIAADGFARVLGGTCAAHQPVEVYPDGQLKSCVANVEKKVAAAPTKEVYVTEFTCAAKQETAFFANGKVKQCTPTEPIYMRGKGTCMAGEPVALQEDGKVAQCTYTYPLYQNKSCKVEGKVSFHANGFFKDCTLPEDKTVGKAVCKADSPISYRPDGTVASCTLAAPAELAPGKTVPANTVVNIDEKQVITVKEAAPPVSVKPAAPVQPAVQPAPAKK